MIFKYKNAPLKFYDVTYLSINFMHLSHLYGHKSNNIYIYIYIFFFFFSFLFLLQTKQRKEKFIFLFSFPLLSLFPNIHKRFNFFSFLFFLISFLLFFSFLFSSLICNQIKPNGVFGRRWNRKDRKEMR